MLKESIKAPYLLHFLCGGYVKRELDSLEDTLNKKLTKALENPLAN